MGSGIADGKDYGDRGGSKRTAIRKCRSGYCRVCADRARLGLGELVRTPEWARNVCVRTFANVRSLCDRAYSCSCEGERVLLDALLVRKYASHRALVVVCAIRGA